MFCAWRRAYLSFCSASGVRSLCALFGSWLGTRFVIAMVTLIVPQTSNSARDTFSSGRGWFAKGYFLGVHFLPGSGSALCVALQGESDSCSCPRFIRVIVAWHLSSWCWGVEDRRLWWLMLSLILSYRQAQGPWVWRGEGGSHILLPCPSPSSALDLACVPHPQRQKGFSFLLLWWQWVLPSALSPHLLLPYYRWKRFFFSLGRWFWGKFLPKLLLPSPRQHPEGSFEQ